jgi:glycosyltransferase involved in cell wall biosynthesis
LIKQGRYSAVVDLRCLQDPGYARRGVGRHALAMLRHPPPDMGLIGLLDDTLPPLLPEARAAVGQIYTNAYAAGEAVRQQGGPAAFIMLSPMTHDPLFVARLLGEPSLLRVAVVYDFIPRHWPDRYLPGATERLQYAMALRWLARCNLFLSISGSSRDELTSLLAVPSHATAVTGCPIGAAFDPGSGTPDAAQASPRHVLVVGGGDMRKNPEVVIRAHALSHAIQRGPGIPLVVGGNYGTADASAFRAVAAAAGGDPALVEVPGHISDDALQELYRRAFVLVCPSRDEGFSLPVIEAMAAGVPCLVSDIPAHCELVADPDCRFVPTDDADLRPKLERAVADAGWRASMLARQADVWPWFRADAVGSRFWDAVLRRLELSAPAVSRGYRPRVALLSPLPPDRSGVADYTAATCAELGKLVDLHVFSETPQPLPLAQVASVRPLDTLPHVSARFDRVVSVIGNSHFHLRIFDLLRRYGGACIAHDARMLGFYGRLLGQDRALDVASRELRRAVTARELDSWLDDESRLEALFLGEIAETAAPTIVHSLVTARLMRERYGTDPAYLPFSIYRPWTAAELTLACRESARRRLGLRSGEVVIATFGSVHGTKAPEECVWALELMRGWGISASLHFVGELNAYESALELRDLCASLGLADQVHFVGGYVSEQTYRDYLLAADLGVQLRSYGLGALSGGLLDCVAVGLPTVTNAALGEAVGVPEGYVRRVPDALSPLLLAEALADILDAGQVSVRPETDREAFAEARSFARYARGLCELLELDLPAAMGRPVSMKVA